MSRLWVYKCNAAAEGGDWNAFFELGGHSDWGSTEWTNNASSLRIIREELAVGDLVLAWQTDMRAALGICRVVGLPVRDNGEILIELETVEHFREPVKLLDWKPHAPALSNGKAFQQGRLGMLYETTPEEQDEILRICGLLNELRSATTPAPRSRSRDGRARPGAEKLDRRTISDTLKKQLGWRIESHVDGSIDFFAPVRTPIDRFADEVRRAVRELGYEPTVRIARVGGLQVVRVHTPETLSQAPRGAHGAT